MKKYLSVIPLVLLLCFVIGCQKPAEEIANEPAVDVEAEKQILEKELRSMEIAHKAAIDSKDIDGVLRFYSSDLITISPEEPILYGNDWIRNTLNDLYNAYEFTEDFKFIDIRIIRDRVAASYSFTQQMTPLAGGEKIEQSGKGMAILKQDEMKNWQFEWNAYYLDNTDTSDKE
jgi:ketosteroid isomerase-like protein